MKIVAVRIPKDGGDHDTAEDMIVVSAILIWLVGSACWFLLAWWLTRLYA